MVWVTNSTTILNIGPLPNPSHVETPTNPPRYWLAYGECYNVYGPTFLIM